MTVAMEAGNHSVWIPVLAQNSGDHFVKLDFFRQDGVLVASRTLQLRATDAAANQVAPFAPSRLMSCVTRP